MIISLLDLQKQQNGETGEGRGKQNQTKQELDKADGAVEPSNKTALVDLEQTVY